MTAMSRPGVADGETLGGARVIRGMTGATRFSILEAPDPEEIYVALSGSGRIIVDGLSFELSRLDAVRVAPASARELQADSDGLEALAFGSHCPGDGEMVAHS